MSNVIGIIELILWLVAVAAVAAAITFGVTRLLPGRDKPGTTPAVPKEDS